MTHAYHGIDHIVIRTADAESLFVLFSGLLGLPVTWPLERAGFATFGWVNIGNTHLEIWAAANNSDLPADCPFPFIHQIAFQPVDLATSVVRVERMGLRCKTPRTYESKNERGELRTNFTNSVILDLSNDACCVFFCDWGQDAPIVPWPKGLTTTERRALEREAMNVCGGGPLGLVGLREIELSTPNLESATDRWRKLTESKEAISITDDIRLRLSMGSQEVVQSLTFAVRDLARHDLLDARDDDEVMLSTRVSQGLQFRFSETET